MARVRIAAHVALFAAVALAVAVPMGGGAQAQRRETVEVERSVQGKPLKIAVQLFLPDKPGGEKVPVIIVMHGSGGVRAEREFAYVNEFLALGVAAVVIDSFSPRGVKSTVRDQSQVTAADMLGDATATLKTIARHPAIDPARIGMIGFSKGGTVTVKAALQRYMASRGGSDARFALLIAMYPWCGDQPLNFRPAGAPLHMLLGAKDSYAGIESCREFGKKLDTQGGKVTIKVYPEAQHGWDVPGSTHWSDPAGQNQSKCVYDEIAPGTWVERVSQIKVVADNKPTGNGKKALAHCMTLGVSGGYDKRAHEQSLRDIRGLVREAFRLQ